MHQKDKMNIAMHPKRALEIHLVSQKTENSCKKLQTHLRNVKRSKPRLQRYRWHRQLAMRNEIYQTKPEDARRTMMFAIFPLAKIVDE